MPEAIAPFKGPLLDSYVHWMHRYAPRFSYFRDEGSKSLCGKRAALLQERVRRSCTEPRPKNKSPLTEVARGLRCREARTDP